MPVDALNIRRKVLFTKHIYYIMCRAGGQEKRGLSSPFANSISILKLDDYS